jgi:hypothetical protein
MRKEKTMENIDEILREMREYGSTPPPRGAWLDLANRIEEAVKVLEAGRDNWLRQALDEDAIAKLVGNTYKIRKALETISKCDISKEEDCYTLYRVCEDALSAPPRNCDVMDWRTAWAKWRTELHTQKPCGYAEALSGTEQFMDWYISEAKEETKCR